jgi:hypothetical protein
VPVYLTAELESLCAFESKRVLQGGQGVVIGCANDAKYERYWAGYACVFQERQEGGMLCCRPGGLALGRGVASELDLYYKYALLRIQE